MDIIVIGSLNMDIVVNVSRIPKVGETILGTKLNYYGGGKGANQALAAGKLGADTTILGKIGKDDYGIKLKDDLTYQGINTKYIDYSKKPTGMAFITVDKNSDNNIVVYPGANYCVDIEQVNKYKDRIINSKICILQLEIPIKTVEYIINLCHENNVLVILNPAPAVDSISIDILKKVDILIPNEIELFLLMNEEFKEHEIENTMRKLKSLGIKELIVTLGEKGGAYFQGNEIKYYNSIEVDAIDTTAAGDSFIGGLAFGLIEGMKLEEAIKYASYVSALTVTREGAQVSLPNGEEVRKFIESRE